jgi:hypothetical protein
MTSITFESVFQLGEIVYLRVKSEHDPGMITGISLRPNNGILYDVSWGTRNETRHFAMELTTEYVPDYAKDSQHNSTL